MQKFYETIKDEMTLPIDFPELPYSASEESTSSKRTRKSTKSINAKKRLNEKKDAKKISKTSEDSKEKSQTNKGRSSWRNMPLYNINRSNLTPLQYIEAYWNSYHIDRP